MLKMKLVCQNESGSKNSRDFRIRTDDCSSSQSPDPSSVECLPKTLAAGCKFLVAKKRGVNFDLKADYHFFRTFVPSPFDARVTLFTEKILIVGLLTPFSRRTEKQFLQGLGDAKD